MDEWHSGQCPHARLNHLGIKDLGGPTGQRHIVHAKPIRQAKQGADIAGILHPIEDQGPTPLCRRQRFLCKHAQNPLRMLERRHLCKFARRDDEGARVAHPIGIIAHHQAFERPAFVQKLAHRLGSFHNELLRLLPALFAVE